MVDMAKHEEKIQEQGERESMEEMRARGRQFIASVLDANPGLCVVAKGARISFGNKTEFEIESFGKNIIRLKALPGTMILSDKEFEKRLAKIKADAEKKLPVPEKKPEPEVKSE